MTSDERTKLIEKLEGCASELAKEYPEERWAPSFNELRKTYDEGALTGYTKPSLMGLPTEAHELYEQYKVLRGQEFNLREGPLV